MTIYLLDPFLLDYSGHCFNYLNFIHQKLAASKVEVLVGGNELVDEVLLKSGVRPVFSKQVLKAQKHKLRHVFRNFVKFKLNYLTSDDVSSFMADMESAMQKLQVTPQDTVFLNSLRPGQFLGLVQWLSMQDRNRCPQFFVVLHFTSRLNSFPGFIYRLQYQRAFQIVKDARLSLKLQLSADTNDLVDEFSTLGAEAVTLAPIPVLMPQNLDKGQERVAGEVSQSEPIVLSFVGQARRDKGFYLLPEIGRALEPLIKAQRIVFKVQASQHGDMDRRLQSAIDELKGLGAVIIDKALSSEDYADFIISSDIILLPYLGAAYKTQSSGIFAEAIALGKVVLVPRETWMGKELAKMELTTLWPDLTPQSIVHYVEHYLKERSEYEHAYRAGSRQWADSQSWDSFIDRVVRSHDKP